MITAQELLALPHGIPLVGSLGLAESSDEDLNNYLDLAGQLLQEDAEKAGAVLAELRAVALERELPALAGEAAYLEARAFLVRGQLHEALGLIDTAAGLWTRGGEPLKAARTGLGRMNVLDDLGRHDEAIRVGEELVESLDRLEASGVGGDEAVWLRAAALENIGVGRGYLGDHDAALVAYEQAEDVYRANGMAEEIARPMANRGVELVELGRLDEALATLRGAAQSFDGQGDNLFAAKCRVYEARAQMLRGDYTASAAAAERAGEYLSAQPPTTEYARIQLVRAETLVSMNLLADALRLIDELIGQFSAAGLEHDLAAAHFIRAAAMAQQGADAEAIAGFIEAEKRHESVGDVAMAAVAQLGRSQLVDELEAEQLAKSAADVLCSSGRPSDRVAAELRLSQLTIDPAEALEHLDRAAQILDEHGLPHLRWKERAERGHRLRQLNRSRAALDAYRSALKGLDEMRRTVDQDVQRLGFMGGRDRVHQDLAALLAESGDVASALQITETARARTLVERLGGEVAGPIPRVAPNDLNDIYTEILESPAASIGSARKRARSMETVAAPAGEIRLAEVASRSARHVL